MLIREESTSIFNVRLTALLEHRQTAVNVAITGLEQIQRRLTGAILENLIRSMDVLLACNRVSLARKALENTLQEVRSFRSRQRDENFRL